MAGRIKRGRYDDRIMGWGQLHGTLEESGQFGGYKAFIKGVLSGFLFTFWLGNVYFGLSFQDIAIRIIIVSYKWHIIVVPFTPGFELL